MTTEHDPQTVLFWFVAEHIRQGIGTRLWRHSSRPPKNVDQTETDTEEAIDQSLSLTGKVAIIGGRNIEIVDTSEGVKDLPIEATVEVNRSTSRVSSGFLSCSVPLTGTETLYHSWMLRVSLTGDVFDKLWDCLPTGSDRILEAYWNFALPSDNLESIRGFVEQMPVEGVRFSIVTKEGIQEESSE